MILIADSGATKSDWLLINKENEHIQIQLAGLNPYYLSPEQTEEVLQKELVPFIEADKVDELYFYGAGCSSVYKCMLLEDTFTKVFPQASTTIQTDLIGSAKALFGDKKGIVGILGTGSNACFFNGEKVEDQVISLGYLFGDEGSGASIGKVFIKDFLTDNLPDDLANKFKNEYNYTRENILDAVYNLPHPNRFLASFSKFFTANIENEYIINLLQNSFRDFFEKQIKPLKHFPKEEIGITGSVAFYFEKQLREVAKEFDANIGQIIQSPIKALAEYHSK